MFDYFYGAQSEQFAFYRVPKVLFTNDRFKYLSAEAKTLYGILLDRVPLSAKNGWIDEQGRVYIICTIEEIMADMNCGNKKAVQLLADLETKVGLIERKRQGLGKPNLIYVKNFISVDNPVERHFLKCQNDTSGSVERTSLEVSKGHGTNTDTGICAKPTLRATAPTSTPHLSPVNSSMSIARKLSKPPEAALTSSFRSLPKARVRRKHSKPKTI